MTHRVIFVCEANVCRSALMEVEFRARMPAGAWDAGSAGTNVRTGVDEMCGVAAEVAEIEHIAHVPAQLTADDIEANHLVIAANRAVRAEVATLVPDMRWKIFTLRELNFLAAQATTRGGRTMIDPPRQVDDLEQFSIMLHARRGLEPSPRSRWWRAVGRGRAHPFDIDDVHASRPAIHRSVLNGIVADIRELREHLVSAVPPSPP